MDDRQKVFIAAGGTGGHIFPAEVVANKLAKKGYDVTLLTDRRCEKYQSGFDKAVSIYKVSSASASGNVVKKLRAIVTIFIGIFEAASHLVKSRPICVIGFGGYPSLPTITAAKMLGCRIVIHEQNALLGRVNKIIAPFADKIAVSFENIKNLKHKYVEKTYLTGTPVRSDIEAARSVPCPELKKRESFHILVVGGSQGAKIFDEVVTDAVCSLPDKIRKKIRIDQQCRAESIDKVKEKYDASGVSADLTRFFSDIATRMAGAHLVIARAGASTISELSMVGRASILIPYKYAMDDHQTHNAKALARKGAAVIIREKELNKELLAEQIQALIDKPEDISKMAINCFDCAVTNATERLVDLVIDI